MNNVVARILIGVVAGMLGAGAVEGGQPVERNLRQAAALKQLQADASGEVIIRYSGPFPSHVSARVDLPASLNDEPLAAALWYLERYRDLYLIHNPRDQLFLSRYVESGPRTTLLFGQRIHQVSFYGLELAIHLEGGAVTGSLGSLATDLAVPSFRVSADEAEALARKALFDTHISSSIATRPLYLTFAFEEFEELIVRPAWRVAASGRPEEQGTVSDWFIFVDAEWGFILEREERRAFHRVEKDFEIRPDPIGDCPGLFGPSGPVWFTETGASPLYPGPPTDRFEDARRNAVNLLRTYEFYDFAFHRHSYDGDGGAVDLFTQVGLRNAYVDPGCRDKMFMGVGFQDGGTVTHEFTHMVSKAIHDGEDLRSFALREGLSDAFAAWQDGDWLMGEDNLLLPGEAPRCLPGRPGLAPGVARSLADPALCEDSNSPARQSSIAVGHAAFLMTEGRSGPGLTVPRMGFGRTPRLWYRVFTSRLPRSAEPVDLRDALADQVREFIRAGEPGFEIADLCTVFNAFASNDIGTADLDCDGRDDRRRDSDGDGVPNETDLCPDDFDPGQENSDGDTEGGDACDPDRDGDTIANELDVCPDVPDADQEDMDGNGVGDACEDRDGDSVLDIVDNCPDVRNLDQQNTDGLPDGGDACDSDDDDDGFKDALDNCPLRANDQADGDGDGVGDKCDNCIDEPNRDQTNTDGLADGGDACDDDDDEDRVLDDADNCPTEFNPLQIDIDGNFVGLLCDFEEEFLLSGEEVRELKGFLRLDADTGRARVPINPCLADCPDSPSADFATRVALGLPDGAAARIVDEAGVVLAASTASLQSNNNLVELFFRPASSAFFRWPVAGLQAQPAVTSEAGAGASRQSGVFRGKQYWLEVGVAPPGNVSEIPISVLSRNLQQPRPGFDPAIPRRRVRDWLIDQDAWPVASLVLGSRFYEQESAAKLMEDRGKSDASIALARQLAATKLNCSAGVNCEEIALTIQRSDAVLADLEGVLPFGISPESALGEQMVQLSLDLKKWNKG